MTHPMIREAEERLQAAHEIEVRNLEEKIEELEPLAEGREDLDWMLNNQRETLNEIKEKYQKTKQDGTKISTLTLNQLKEELKKAVGYCPNYNSEGFLIEEFEALVRGVQPQYITEYETKYRDVYVHDDEVCICAAVKSEDGSIFRGHRHADCIKAMLERGKTHEKTQGR